MEAAFGTTRPPLSKGGGRGDSSRVSSQLEPRCKATESPTALRAEPPLGKGAFATLPRLIFPPNVNAEHTVNLCTMRPPCLKGGRGDSSCVSSRPDPRRKTTESPPPPKKVRFRHLISISPRTIPSIYSHTPLKFSLTSLFGILITFSPRRFKCAVRARSSASASGE